MPTRLLLLAVAVLALVLAITRTVAVDGCSQAGKDAQRVAQGKGGSEAAVIRRLKDACRGADELSQSAAVFAGANKPAAALSLAREAVRRENDNFLAYDALAFALRGSKPQAAKLAVLRAQQLNPRGRAVTVP